jgi:hypothetical protein
MKFTELKNGSIYGVKYDKALRLKYNGTHSIRNQMNSYDILASFTCVDRYSNGFVITKSFDTYRAISSDADLILKAENSDLILLS